MSTAGASSASSASSYASSLLSATTSDLTSRLRTFSFSEKTTVVIELGYCHTKVGFAGEAKPRNVIPTKVISQPGGFGKNSSKNIFEIDNEAELRFVLIDFINHLFIRHILLTPKDKTVIIAEPLFLPIWFRKMLLNVLFQDIQVGSVFVGPSSMFALFGLGWRSGIVVDCDAFETSVLPVCENVAILKAVESVPVGFSEISENLKMKLKDEADWPQEVINDELIDDLIPQAYFFVDRFDRIEARRNKSGSVTESADVVYQSSFGGKYPPMTVPGYIRESLGEPLFDSDSTSGSVTQAVLSCLERCPIDVRKLLAERLVLIGSCSSLPGFASRLISELESAVSKQELGDRRLPPAVTSVKSFKCAMAPIPSHNLAWFGAAVFGHLEVATQRAITRDKFHAELKAANGDFNSSKVLTADWLTTPMLIPYPDLTASPTEASSSSC